MSVPGVEKALEEYNAVLVDHPRLREAVSGLRSFLVQGRPARVIALVGPTGVGKSTVLEVVQRELAAEAPVMESIEDNRAPAVVRVVCLPPGSKGFEFGQLHWRLLSQAAGGVFPDDHICPDEEAKRLKKGGVNRQGHGNVDEQRLGVQTFLRQNGVRAVVFDEAQYITRIRSARTQADQLDLVKDCVDRSGLPHVLAGTYELNALFNANEQAVRRLRVHHFRPYYFDVPGDLDAFVQVIYDLILALPLPEPTRSLDALEPHLRTLCVRSLGCVGVLKDWIADGLGTVLEEGREVLDWATLSAPDCGLSDDKRIELAKKIIENRRLGQRNELADVEEALGLARDSGPSSGAVGPTGPGRLPGRRRATRDPVGLGSGEIESEAGRSGTGTV